MTAKIKRKYYRDEEVYVEAVVPFYLYCRKTKSYVGTVYHPLELKCKSTHERKGLRYTTSYNRDVVVEIGKKLFSNMDFVSISADDYDYGINVKRDGKIYNIPTGFVFYVENANTYVRNQKILKLKDL
jgi:hypothetical protein